MFGVILSFSFQIWCSTLTLTQDRPLSNTTFLIIISIILISFALKPFFNIDQVGRLPIESVRFWDSGLSKKRLQFVKNPIKFEMLCSVVF